MICPGSFASAGYIQDKPEYFPSHVFNGRGSGCDAAGVDVDKVGPAVGERGARGYFDYRNHSESIGATLAGREDMHVHRRQLLRAADEVAGWCRREDQSFRGDALSVASNCCKS